MTDDIVLSEEQATQFEREELRERLQEIVDSFAAQLNAVTDAMLEAVAEQAIAANGEYLAVPVDQK